MDSPHQRPSEEELRIFSERIAGRLAEEPVELDPMAHREQVAGVLRRFGDATHYELLGIAPTASTLEVHNAYDGIGRLVHPANAPRLGLEGKEAVLELLFENVTQAYLCLSSPERRKPYDRELGPAAWAAAATAPAANRDEESRELARLYFTRAVARVDAEDFYAAIELIQQAVRNDPRGEYYAMLGRLEAKNPLWLHRAAESLRHAIELKTADSGLRSALDEVNERLRAGEAQSAPAAAAATLKGKKSKKRDAPEVEVVPEEEGEVDLPLPDSGGRGRRRTK